MVTSSDCEVTFGSTNDSSQLRAQQSDGMGAAAYKPTGGALDNSFDGDGRNFQGGHFGYDITPYGDGDWVSAGEANTAGWEFDVVRWNGDGSVQWRSSPAQAGCDDCMAFGVDVFADGDTVVAGRRRVVAEEDLGLMRLQADGTLDPGFAAGIGYLGMVRAGAQIGYDVVEQPGRGIVAAGSSAEGGDIAAFVVRYTDAGVLDSSFGVGGIQVLQVTGGIDRAYELALQDDGSILVAGAASGDLFVTRLTANGQLDTSFGSGGTRVVDTNTVDNWEQEKVGLGIDPRTRDIIAAIEYGNGVTSQTAVARMDEDGDLVGSFGAGGLVVHDLVPGNWEDPDGLLVEPDGRIVVPFVRGDDLDSGWAVRLRPDGSRDPLFGSNGLLEVSNATTDDQYGINVDGDSDGRLVALAGDTVSRFATSTIPDLVPGSQDWNQGSGMFGACLRSLVGGTTDVTTWALDGDATCTADDADPWMPITGAGSKVARRLTPGTATARLRFGVRVPTATTPGSYIAPIRFTVVAPDA